MCGVKGRGLAHVGEWAAMKDVQVAHGREHAPDGSQVVAEPVGPPPVEERVAIADECSKTGGCSAAWFSHYFF